jgi:hypothetical protein
LLVSNTWTRSARIAPNAVAIQAALLEYTAMLTLDHRRKSCAAAFIAVALAFSLVVQGGVSLLLERGGGHAGYARVGTLSQWVAGVRCAKDGSQSDLPTGGHAGGTNCASCVMPGDKGSGLVVAPLSALLLAILRPESANQPSYAHEDPPLASGLEGWASTWTSQGPPST